MLKLALYLEPRTIDYSETVAGTIANKLSFGMDTVDTWNVDQAPNYGQFREFVKKNKNTILASMTPIQRENLFRWMLKPVV